MEQQLRIHLPGGGHAKLVRHLRYGENPRVKNVALIRFEGVQNPPLPLSSFKQIAGTDPSQINMTDFDRVLKTGGRIAHALHAEGMSRFHVAIAVKHGNTCGAAVGRSPEVVLKRMIEGDDKAITGAFVLTNFPLTGELADVLRTHRLRESQPRFFDGIAAPDFKAEAVDALARRNGKCRLFANRDIAGTDLSQADHEIGMRIRQIAGGAIVADPDTFLLRVQENWRTAPKSVLYDILFAWAIGSTSNSNSIVLVRHGMFLGAGLCQVSRVKAAKVAVMNARDSGHDLTGAVAYSDSFFPMVDGPQVLAEAGITHIFATSGSLNDAKVRDFCAEAGITLFQLPDEEARGFFGH